jgi:hypothetical protein
VKRELERIEIPDEHGARERAWSVVQAAFADRQPIERRSRRLRPVLALAALLAVVAAALSSPGRAVIDELREVVGIERAQRALFSLPSGGKLLVASDDGVWVVQQDGSRRRLGDYREASWSPFGRFVIAGRENELTAFEPDGDVRWTVARRGVRSPRWAGTETDTRVAYFDRTGLRLVAGDGTDDRLIAPKARGRLAWRPDAGFVLAYAFDREVRVLDVVSGRTLWRAPRRPPAPVTAVEWSSDGERLLVLSPQSLKVYDTRGRVVQSNDPADGWPNVDARFRPDTHEVAVARVHGSQSTAFGLPGSTFANFNGTGEFRELEWSPDGRWLLVTWSTADQWVFVRANRGPRRIRAVASISNQFRSQSFPRVEGWCCAQ